MQPNFESKHVSPSINNIEAFKVNYTIEVSLEFDHIVGTKMSKKITFPITVYEGNKETCQHIYLPDEAF